MKLNEDRISDEIRGSMHKQILVNAIMFSLLAVLIAYGINLQQANAVARSTSEQKPIVEPVKIDVMEVPSYRRRILDEKPVSSGGNYGFPGGRLWKFSSGCWTGYIDIRTDGLYYTHWGYGHWSKQDDGSYLLQNDHDGFSHTLRKKNDNVLIGERVDGVWERCDLIYDYAAKQQQPYDPKFMPDSKYSPAAFEQ